MFMHGYIVDLLLLRRKENFVQNYVTQVLYIMHELLESELWTTSFFQKQERVRRYTKKPAEQYAV